MNFGIKNIESKIESLLKQNNLDTKVHFQYSSYNNFDNELKDLLDIHKLGLEEKNEEILNDCSLKIEDLIKKLKKKEINCFLSGENDKLDIYLEIHAGAGGTESQDWAEMLRRMYLKWFDRKNFKYQMISEVVKVISFF